MPRRRPLLCAAMLATGGALLAIGAMPASAAPVGSVTVSGGEVQVSGGAGAATWTATQSGADIAVSVGGGDTISALAGCTQTNASTVTCPANRIVVDFSGSGAGQTLSITGTMPSVVVGSDFADTITGGSGPDRISGRKGADVINGGAGSDTAFYGSEGALGEPEADRTTGVTVTLDGVANDGSAGYDGNNGGLGGDNVGATVENVYGTAFADTLTGDAQDNLLSGRRGPDVLTGGLGSDRLVGQFGNDTLNAQDGIADAEVNCNNSDESRDEQPNTVNYDAGLDSPVNCAESPGGTGSGESGGGSAAGLRPLSFVTSNWQVVDQSSSWVIPANLAPVERKGGKFTFPTRQTVRSAVAKSSTPIIIEEKTVGITAVPRKMQRSVKDGLVVAVSPAPGARVSGTTTSPATITVTSYDSLVDKRGGCRYDDALVKSVKGVDAAFAWRVLKSMKCRLIIQQRFGGSAPNPVVFGAAIKADKDDGKPRLLLRVRYPTPDTLDMVVMPRDPDTIGGGAWADKVGGELTFGYQKDREQRGMLLRRAPRNLTTISVLVKDTALGLPVVSDPPGTACRQLLDVRLLDPDDEVVASQVSASADGRVTFTFGAAKAGTYSIVATTTPGASGNCSPLEILYGTQQLRVIDSLASFATVDGRCFKASGAGKGLRWNGIDCESAAAKGIDRLGTIVRDAVLARVFTARSGGVTSAERAIASRLCMRDATGYGPEFLMFNPGAAVNFCSDTEVVDIMQALAILPGSLGGTGERAVPLGVGSPVPSNTPAAAVVKTPEFAGPESFTGVVPTVDTNGPQGAVIVEHDRVLSLGQEARALAGAGTASSVSGVLANTPSLAGGGLINLDGAGLINLDGAGLINLDGAGLINLDGAGLINLDGAGLIGRNGASLGGLRGSPIASLRPGLSPVGLVSDQGSA